jgi:Sulfotransferase domain
MITWFGRKRSRSHIFLACFPKSGSTFLSTALQGLTGYSAYSAAEEYGHNEQDISRRKLRRARRTSIIQQHAKGSKNNLNILRQYSMRPIVHVRNLFDVVISLHDHLFGEDHCVPTGYVHREFWRLSQREQFDYLIHVHLPWYFNFLVSWHEAQRHFSLIMTSYEELFADPPGTLRRLADFYGFDVDDAAIERALHYVSHQHTRFNKGVTGRGRELLTSAQCDAIRSLAKVWGVDQQVTRSVGIDLTSLQDEPIRAIQSDRMVA